MSERVSSEDVTAFINLATLHLYPSRDLEKETLPVEVKIAFDLLDARAALRLLLADVREVRENEPGERMIPTQHQVSDLRVARAAGGGEDE